MCRRPCTTLPLEARTAAQTILSVELDISRTIDGCIFEVTGQFLSLSGNDGTASSKRLSCCRRLNAGNALRPVDATAPRSGVTGIRLFRIADGGAKKGDR